MDQLQQQIKRMSDKLQQLLKQYHLLQKENETLKNEVKVLALDLRIKSGQMDELGQRIEILKMNNGDWEEADKKELEKRLNQYIREIDRCITMLNE